MSKRFLLIPAVAVLFALPALPKDDGFTGKWILDKPASTASFDIPDNLMQQIKKKGSELTIQTTWREPANGITPMPLLGIMVTDLRLSVDGQDVTNEIGPFKQASRTTMRANTMVTDYTALVNGEQVTGQWTRTLSDDGKDMTLAIDQKSGSKSNQGKLVFHRK